MHHDHLPLPDYEHLPISSLEHRIRSLTAEELQQLLTYEHAHANRVPVVELLRARLDQLDAGAEPTTGSGELRPEQPGSGRAGSPVSPDSATEPHQPLRHGVAGQTPNRGSRQR